MKRIFSHNRNSSTPLISTMKYSIKNIRIELAFFNYQLHHYKCCHFQFVFFLFLTAVKLIINSISNNIRASGISFNQIEKLLTKKNYLLPFQDLIFPNLERFSVPEYIVYTPSSVLFFWRIQKLKNRNSNYLKWIKYYKKSFFYFHLSTHYLNFLKVELLPSLGLNKRFHYFYYT